MQLEELIREATEIGGVRHCLLVRNGDGQWQVSTRTGDAGGFHVEIDPDPVLAFINALEKSLPEDDGSDLV